VSTFQWPVRVYYEDTDSGGVVYYANYLKFFERARTEFFRSKGFEQDQLRDEQQVIFAVVEAHVQYLKPAIFNDALLVMSELSAVNKAGMCFTQKIYDKKMPEKLLCAAEIRIACLNEKTFRPIRIPENIRKEIIDEC
jgi:acyl-CoA thioester hydrolase